MSEKAKGQSVQKFRFESEAEKLQKSKLRMEKSGEDLERAREKLAGRKPVKQPGPVKRISNVAKTETWAFVHGKIHEVENENVGVEGAHKAELFSESALRTGNYHVKKAIRTAPEKKVFHAERRDMKARADYQYRSAKQEHPELKQNRVQQFWKWQQIKRKAKATSPKKKLTNARLKSNGTVILVLLALLLLILQSCSSSVITIANSLVGAVGASSFQAEETQLRAAEEYYCSMEDELRQYLDSYEWLHDYDEYSYDLDSIEHDPYILLSILSSIHDGEWTLDDVKGTLNMLFQRQYILTETLHLMPGEEERIACFVKLENKKLDRLPIEVLSKKQLERYAVYKSALGNMPELYPNSDYVKMYSRPPTMHTVPEQYFQDRNFAAIMEEAEKYIGYPYVWGGSSPSTSFDCSGYVCYVYNKCGKNVGRTTAQGLYNMCARVSNPIPGDLVFFKGTYDTPEVSHVGIYVGDGWMLQCGDPIQYADLTSSYWQEHFYAYGRLR